ncbi:Hypothetical protein D9617_1g079820 [Elsinoe fawcettii]|nr:Hypothetical protein D9617_1g079820 [Elsinoe fawcettii]
MGKSNDNNPYMSDVAVPASESRNPFRRAMNAFSGSNHQEQSLGTDTYQPPSGPPPSHSEKPQYAPPAGPPPSQSQNATSYAPPSGPPPSRSNNPFDPPPYDPWLSVPDNSSLPPPPSISHETSPTSNAPQVLADSARAWTAHHALYAPRTFPPEVLTQIAQGDLGTPFPPPDVRGKISSSRRGNWTFASDRKGTGMDAIFLSPRPLYAARHHDPRLTGRKHTIYFELKITKLDDSSGPDGEIGSAVAIGFVAPPYPAWRLPGWERASLGVHSDDGRRYINNNRGGIDFTTNFGQGETVGVGMVFEDARGGHVGGVQGRNNVRVFFTSEGRMVGGWDLWEERDADEEEGDPEGLGGERDLCAAVGMFGRVEVEWRGLREEWLYRPGLH